MPRLHPTSLLLFPLRVLAIPFTTLIARIPHLRSRHRRTRTLTMLLPLLILLLILLALLPLYIIFRPPHALIRSMAEKYPDTLWEIPPLPSPNTNSNNDNMKGGGGEKIIALTIDDAPSAYTLDILHLLQEYNARATFFLIGSQIPGREGILHTLVKSGMELGNHAMHDEPSVSLEREVLEQEMQEVEGVIARVYEEVGVERPRDGRGVVRKWFRPGSGFFSGWMRELVRGLGYRIVLGSVYPHDAQIGWAGVNAWHVRSLVREGSIVVMHDRRSWTVEGLRRVLPVLRDRGFRVVGLGEAMGIVDAANNNNGDGGGSTDGGGRLID
ncbi:hypothetical protein ASPTUDRAFT_231989 [Aspergillus tubingensis CBS 134.48]|uniref:chitin deacetylase n=1 Tax=Aspergillus tubingensis (strain CBS 134.48) TaxID=767770 RepID=A0A1L9NM83_ASPTC|nr:hypothetical protein ASPTUDRAFT_231989 [Aspergillus tubingensis CBS 134.48]